MADLPTTPGALVLARVYRLGDELRRLVLTDDGGWVTHRGGVKVDNCEITDWVEVDPATLQAIGGMQ